MHVNATLGFGGTGPRVEIVLPDENYVREILASLSETVAGGPKHVLHLLYESAPEEPFPRHGVIEFGDPEFAPPCGPLYVDGEGPWWLYVRHRFTARDVAVKVISNVAHVLLTVKS